jgi:type 1 glutamine amidotransferase
MRFLSLILTLAIAIPGILVPSAVAQTTAAKPVKALLVIGGCCHDYKGQKTVLEAGLEERLNIDVVVAHDAKADGKTNVLNEVYNNPDWYKGYDVIIHDECSADVKDPVVVAGILKAHQEAGIPAVNLHCAMHCYRVPNSKAWFEFIGLRSTGHGPQVPIDITWTDTVHPAAAGMQNWTTIKEELYNNVEVYPTAVPLAKGKQVVKDKAGVEKTVEAVVVWASEYGPSKVRVFNTTLGHNTETVNDARYLDLVARGVLWAAGRLDASGKPVAGAAK